MIADYNIFTNINSRNYYAGINLNIQSICLIFIFSLFPSFLITNNINHFFVYNFGYVLKFYINKIMSIIKYYFLIQSIQII